MSLEVTVLSASNLPDVDSKDKGVSDPFVELTFRGKCYVSSLRDSIIQGHFGKHLV